MIVYFYKTSDINGRSHVKTTLRLNVTSNIGKIDKFCCFWSLLASLLPCNSIHLNRVSKYRKYFNDLNIQDFDFTIGFKSSDVHNF